MDSWLLEIVRFWALLLGHLWQFLNDLFFKGGLIVLRGSALVNWLFFSLKSVIC